MKDDDAEREQLGEIYGLIEILGKTLADQQVLMLRFMAHQQAHLAVIRDLIVRMGEDRTMLGQRLEAAYESALSRYQDQFSTYLQSGDAIAFLKNFHFPDDTLGN